MSQDAKQPSPIKQALFELRAMRARVEELEKLRAEPIAIVGHAVRFPGAPDSDSLWHLLQERRHAITDVPAERWNAEEYFDPDPDAPGMMSTRRGGFLPAVDRFDAHFFGVSPREADSMDPQQRLVLETSWRALEDAGIAPADLVGSATGVFVGLSNVDYLRLVYAERDAIDGYSASGTTGAVAAGRLSYLLGLRGPSLVVDTACSSSLVAIHLACQSLRLKECDVALTGGVNLILTPDLTISCSKARMMAPDGLCKTFDARADGYVRSEGCGMIALKRLADAQRDGDRVLAIIRGSAINQDGRSGGLTVPNGPAQEAVVRRALANAGVKPGQVSYVEAHGTGTSLGDPIEVRALANVFAEGRGPGNPLAIGSIKANVGHLEAAAGVAGLIKVVLAFRHGEIPGHPHLGELNPHVDWARLPVAIPTAPLPWPVAATRRIAGVSSFGFSGTNAHLIVEEPPAAAAGAAAADRAQHVLTISARTPEALAQLAGDFERVLTAGSDALADVCFTANTGRSHFAHRLAVAGTSAAEVAAALAEYRGSGQAGRLVHGVANGAETPQVVFLFTGQGAQYAGMGRRLYETEPSFRRTIDHCGEVLRDVLPHPLTAVLFPQSDDDARWIDETTYTQPALFAIEYALAQLWRSWGIEPAAVIGHSVGELVAACVAGVMPVEDGLRLIATRARLMQERTAPGEMLSALGNGAAVRAAVARHAGQASIAAENGPDLLVVSGTPEAIRAIAAELESARVKLQRLATSRAFHSPLMEPMLDEFEEAAARITYQAPRLPLISNLTGELAGPTDIGSGYWRRHVRGTVAFQHGIEALRRRGHRNFLEIGPTPALLGMARRFVEDRDALWLPSLRRGRDDWETLLASAGQLYVHGAPLNWRGVDAEFARRKVTVPGHPFERRRYWMAVRPAGAAARTALPAGDESAAVHPLLGSRLESPLDVVLFRNTLGTAPLPYLAEHRVFGSLVFPATGYLEMAAAAAAALGEGTRVVEELIISEALTIPETGGRVIQVVLTSKSEGDAAIQVFSRASEGHAAEWRLHASATVRTAGAAEAMVSERLQDVRRRVVATAPTQYELFEASGIEYGPAFRSIAELWRGSFEALGRIQLPAETRVEGYTLHPALLDSCFHVLLAGLADPAAAFSAGHFYLPVGVGRLRVLRPIAAAAWSHARLRPVDGAAPESITADLVLFDENGDTVAIVEALTAKRTTAAALKGATQRARTDWLYEVGWQPKPNTNAVSAIAAGDVWAIAGDDSPLRGAIAARLKQAGAQVVALDESGDAGPLSGVLCLWDGADRGEATAESIEAAIQRRSDAIVTVAGQTARGRGPARLVTAMRAGESATASLADAAVAALTRTFSAEHQGVRCVSVELGGTERDADLLWQELASPDGEEQVAYRGERFVARLRPARRAVESASVAAARGPVELTIGERGILDNLRVEPAPRREPGPAEVEIEVAASGVNFRDVLNVLGMYPGNPGALGNECVGTITRVGPDVASLRPGQRVIALVHGGFRSYAIAPALWVVPAPVGMPFEDAATIPMAFATAEYSLTRLAGLRRGERVLIHAATGGVGLAAVQIAQRAGAEIFATAGSDEKRALLARLGVQHVMNSRTVTFAEEILERTNGEGVDVVLNSLTGDAIARSIAVLRPNGRFVEIGKRGIWTPEEVAAARPDVAYHVVFLGDVDKTLMQSVLQDLVAAFDQGELRPLPRRTYPIGNAVDAFRYMAQAKHVGKIVLTFDARADARGGVRADASYLITGGFGGLGLRMARALAAAGARHLVLVGRSGLSAAADAAVAELEAAGTHVVRAAADISRPSDVAQLLEDLSGRVPPLAGIVHAAGVRDDGVLEHLDRERFARVLAPKLAGAWNLHAATAGMDLDFFVMFSSAASVLPTPAQGNYAAANAFLDALAHYRQARALPALSINWGPWAEVGMAAGLAEHDQRRWKRRGLRFIGPDEGVRLFERLLGARTAQVAVMPTDWRKFDEEREGGTPLLAELTGQTAHAREGTPVAAAPQPALAAQLAAVAQHARREVVLAHVEHQVRQVLALEAGFAIDPNRGLGDIGMDSLMALELRNRLQRSVGHALPATLTFDRPTVAALASHLSDLLGVDATTAAEPAAPRRTVGVSHEGEDEPLAVVGIGCRLPGGVEDAAGFWRLLHDGVDAIREVPRDRWDIDEYFSDDPDALGKMYTRFGGFIDRVDGFDPAFFGISPREAVSLDPQQRLLLEVAWEALEHAGQPPTRLLGTRTGVFVGISTYDYALLHMKTANPAAVDTYFGTGTALSVAAGRLAYSLGLQGPCMAVDTACSSSLVAIHLACKSLRDRECRVALAGGVNLMLTPEPTVTGCRMRMLAPDGRCKTFDASADGYARGEGAGVVVLKRLSDARADGDRILAVIRGTAVNQDGRSSGLTVPNGTSQQAVIREALENAGVQPHEIDYVEAHGTGTSLGDPIEIEALRQVLADGRSPEHPLVVGSLKTNIGHLEAAAGVAALIKVVLAMRNEEIPAHLHFRTLNPHISLEGTPLTIARERQPWRAGAIPRLAGVSSFGFSGTNAHVIVADPPADAGRPAPAIVRPRHILALSAKSKAALDDLSQRYVRYFEEDAGRTSFADVCATANAGRSHFGHRLAVTAGSSAEAAQALRASVSGGGSSELHVGTAPQPAPAVAFLFPGQGAQYAGMARGLFETQPVFRAAMERCDSALLGAGEPSIVGRLSGPAASADVDETGATQPLLFAVEYALAELWRSWGIQPAAMLGHSLGEYVAACVAGVFSLEDAVRLIAARARLMQATADGAMAAVLADEGLVRGFVERGGRPVAIAAINGPANVVISGVPADVAATSAELAAAGVAVRPLRVTRAFHSALMDGMLDEFERVARQIRYAAPRIPIVSSVTGALASAEELTDPAYWRRQVREAVRFADALRTLQARGPRLFLEVGPGSTLTALGRGSVTDPSAVWLTSIRKDRDDWHEMLHSVAALYVQGAEIDWPSFEAPYSRATVTVPAYPFQRERFWIEPSAAPSATRSAQRLQQSLLGRRLRSPVIHDAVFELELSLAGLPYLRDHEVHGLTILPASVLLEAAMAAGGAVINAVPRVSEFTVEEALVLEADATRLVQIVVASAGGDAYTFEISTVPADEAEPVWTRHASGRLQRQPVPVSTATDTLATVEARCQDQLPVGAFLERLHGVGLALGPAFRAMRSIHRGSREALVEVQLPESLARGEYACHPVMLDACINALGAALPDPGMTEMHLLTAIGELQLTRTVGSRIRAHATLEESGAGTIRGRVRLIDDNGEVVGWIDRIDARRAPRAALARRTFDFAEWAYELSWDEKARPQRADRLLTPSAIVEGLTGQLDAASREGAIQSVGHWLPRLEAACTAYVVQALRTCGWVPAAGARHLAASLASELRIVSGHERLLRRMLWMLVEDGVLRACGDDEFEVVRVPEPADPDALVAALAATAPDAAIELGLVGRCGQRLADVLRGESDPIELLFPGGSLEPLERLYQESPVSRAYQTFMRDAIAAAVRELPSGRPLSVLEIGAGTGATTEAVLPVFDPSCTRYVFSDVSPLFADRAAEKFSRYPFMEYRVFDVERDPEAQGVSAGEFDLIVAANVLHATRSLAAVLQRARHLLAPGGVLAIIEAVRPHRWLDITFGLTDGWWKFEDTDLRQRHPLLSGEQWQTLLRNAWFDEVAHATTAASEAGPLSAQALLLASAPAQAESGARRHTADAGRWLIVADRGGVAAALDARVRAAGGVTTVVAAPASTGAAASFEQDVVSALRDADHGSPWQVVYLGGLDATPASVTTADDLQTFSSVSCAAAMHLTRAVRASASAARLWIATRHAQHVPGPAGTPDMRLAATPLWGFGRVIGLEQPDLWGGLIDLDDSGDDAARLFDEIAGQDLEDQVALRGSRRVVPRLTRVERGLPVASTQLHADGSYLITGGLGSIGLRVARWMAEHGARHLVLVGRRGAPAAEDPEAAHVHEAIRAIEALGGSVRIAAADAADRASIAPVLAACDPPLRGVIHAAAALSSASLDALGADQIAQMLRSKATGAWVLHQLTSTMPLDFFVLFSSTTGLLGSKNLAHYAAANVVLDSVAHYRRSLGLPAASVDWGVWEQMWSASAADRRLVEHSGLKAMAGPRALEALGAILQEERAQTVIADVDWSVLIPVYESKRQRPLLDRLRTARRAAPASAGAADLNMTEQLRAARPRERRDMLLAHVRAEAARVLGHDAQRLDVRQGLFDMGLDSLMSVDLKSRLERSLHWKLPATLTFNHPSVEAIVDFLFGELALEESVAETAAAAAGVAPAGGDQPASNAPLEDLSEDELATLLAEKLAGVGTLGKDGLGR